MGEWLAQYGDSIYGTRGGPIAPHPWGVTTQKANKVYVHVLEWPDPVLPLPALPDQVTAAYALKDHAKVDFSKSGDSLLLKLPPRASGDFDTVVVLETAAR
jgi:alpha-L-fucosidase